MGEIAKNFCLADWRVEVAASIHRSYGGYLGNMDPSKCWLLGSLCESNSIVTCGIHNNAASLWYPCEAIHFRVSTYSVGEVKNVQRSLVRTRSMTEEYGLLLKNWFEDMPDDFRFDRWLLGMLGRRHRSWSRIISDLEVWPWAFSCKLKDGFV